VTTGGTAGRQLETIGWLHRVFAQHRVEYWLLGGWAVDFHAGRVTRHHEDVDVAVWRADLERIRILLEVQGWFEVAGPETDGHTAYERRAVRLDLALLAPDAAGRPCTPRAWGRDAWPSGSFGDAQAELDGVPARLVQLASLIADKTGSRGDSLALAKDRVDLAVLTRLRTNG
jgi:hypothetical protein